MALIEHDLPLPGVRDCPTPPGAGWTGWSGGRDERFTASLDTLAGGL
jgi:hypothetical protein